jgi:quinol monooxygenase YgiN
VIYVLATIKASPGKAAALITAAQPCIAATRLEDGCISYDYVQDTADPDIVIVIERWTNREALEAHLHAPHLKEWREARKPLVSSTKIEIIHASNVETF